MKKKFTSLLAAVMLLMTAFGASQAAANEAALSDVNGHWAEAQIEAWVEQGFVKGYEDGSFKPDEGISRAQFFALINRAFGLINKTDVSYSDVNASAWYVSDVQKAVEAGYASGVSESIMKPNEVVSREQAASMIARLLEVEANADAVEQFKDADSIASWSKGAVGALAAKGYMSGHTNGNFGPSDKLSRAQAVTLLNKLGTYYSQAGSFEEETIEGNVIVSAADVKIKGAVITGDLIVTEGVAEGDVYFEDVTVKGNTIIKGGGVKSVFFINSALNDLSVGKKYTPVRVVLSGSSTAGAAEVTGGAILEEENASAGGFGDVAVGEDSDVTLRGSFADVTVEGSGASVTTESGTSVQNLTVEEDAEDATVNVENNSNVSQLTLNSPTTVTGQGTIQTANVNAEGSTIEQRPINIILADGVTVTAAGQEVTNSTSNVPGGYYPTPVQTVANVSSVGDIHTALANPNIKTIVFSQDIDAEEPIAINKANVVIDGNNKTLTINTTYNTANKSADAVGVLADGVTIQNLTVAQDEKNTSEEVTNGPKGDNLIEIYGNYTTLRNVTVKNSEKAGIYVNNDNKGNWTVTFENVTTINNTWAGIGLVARTGNDTINVKFLGTNSFDELIAVYTDDHDKYTGNYNVPNIPGYKKVGHLEKKQNQWLKDILKIDNAKLFVANEDTLRLEFSINQSIDFDIKNVDVKISYFEVVDGVRVALKNSEKADSALVKDRTWDGYLVNILDNTKYSKGADENNQYVQEILGNTALATLVKKNYDYMGSNEGFLDAGKKYLVVIEVTNDFGNTVTEEVETE